MSGQETCWTLIDAAAAGSESQRAEFVRLYQPVAASYFQSRWGSSPLRSDIDDAVLITGLQQDAMGEHAVPADGQVGVGQDRTAVVDRGLGPDAGPGVGIEQNICGNLAARSHAEGGIAALETQGQMAPEAVDPDFGRLGARREFQGQPRFPPAKGLHPFRTDLDQGVGASADVSKVEADEVCQAEGAGRKGKRRVRGRAGPLASGGLPRSVALRRGVLWRFCGTQGPDRRRAGGLGSPGGLCRRRTGRPLGRLSGRPVIRGQGRHGCNTQKGRWQMDAGRGGNRRIIPHPYRFVS